MPTPLAAELKSHIRAQGPMQVSAFMESCLYHPQWGYYTRGLNFQTTPPQDFLTAPEHTPLFGYTLANWVAAQWQRIGSPAAFTLAEAGPGRGTLMRDILAHLQAAHPACFTAARPAFIETSPALKTMQSQTLAAFPHRHAATLSELPAPAIFLANELVDSFPINQYLHINNELFEILVDINRENTLCFITETKPSRQQLPPGCQLTDGATFETAPTEAAFLEEVKTHAAAALLIDYGAQALPSMGANTLQAIHRHTPVGPLHLPGECDLTAHVNFGSMAAVLGPGNCTLEDLAPFLLAHDLPALGLQHPSQQPKLHRLLHPAQMGTLFKALCFTPNTR